MKDQKDSELTGPLDPVEIPIDGILDLHLFRPAEAGQLVLSYLDECLEEDILDVRIIHGKGKGVLRQIVHKILAEHPNVVSFKHDSMAGSWGATVITLKKTD
jgi:DNA-nicking Smr family endonuclease